MNPNRDTIFAEQAEILQHDAFAGDQYVMRLHAPRCAEKATAGQFVHLTVDPLRPLKRPISIMQVSAENGWVDLLYKVVGEGTELLARRKPGESLEMLGPIGQPFNVTEKRPLLIGGGVGMPPMIFIADQLRQQNDKEPFVILGSEVPFPFQPRPSQIMVPGVPEGVIAAAPLLEDWNIASRLASKAGFPGTFDGYVTDLARTWLEALSPEQRQQVGVYACGPHPMLAGVVQLAREFDLPVQVSLEEFMACAVGGCAGCVVEVNDGQDISMQRVCVDGPVFDGYQVF
ncbi:MAG: dihydroorotate dehydrogenase electron transfer subunit [bacterium]